MHPIELSNRKHKRGKAIMIDKNKTCMEAMDSFIEGDPQKGKELLEAFLKQVGSEGGDHCPCPEPYRYKRVSLRRRRIQSPNGR